MPVTLPTIGASADTWGGTLNTAVNNIDGRVGVLEAAGGGSGVVTVTALPTAGAAYRSKLYAVQGATGVADVLYICEKTSLNTYQWTPITPEAPVIVTSSITWVAIAANAALDRTVSVAGVQAGDFVDGSPQADPGSAFDFEAFCFSANTVTIRAQNISGISATPATVSWRVSYRSSI